MNLIDNLIFRTKSSDKFKKENFAIIAQECFIKRWFWSNVKILHDLLLNVGWFLLTFQPMIEAIFCATFQVSTNSTERRHQSPMIVLPWL